MYAPTTSHSLAGNHRSLSFLAAVCSGTLDKWNMFKGTLYISIHIYPVHWLVHKQSCLFSIPMWLLCSCFNICICNWDSIITHFPFMATPSIKANSCLIGQYFCMPCATSSFSCSQSFMIYDWSSYKCTSLVIASSISCIDVQTGRSTAVSNASMFMLRPHTSLSLFSLWLCYDSQSTMNSSGPGLFSLCTLYWCMHRIMQSRYCDNVATSLPITATNGFLSVMTYTWCSKE